MRAFGRARLGCVVLDAAAGPAFDASRRPTQTLAEGWLRGNAVGAIYVAALGPALGPACVQFWALRLIRSAIRARIPVIARDPDLASHLDQIRHEAVRQIAQAQWRDFGASGRRKATFAMWNISPQRGGNGWRSAIAATQAAPQRFLPQRLAAQIAACVGGTIDARRFEAPQRIVNAA